MAIYAKEWRTIRFEKEQLKECREKRAVKYTNKSKKNYNNGMLNVRERKTPEWRFIWKEKLEQCNMV